MATPRDVNRIYGNGEGRSTLTRRFEQQLRAWTPNVTLVTETWKALESQLVREQSEVERTARVLYDAGEADLARRYLTRCSETESMRALELGETLARSIEARTKCFTAFGLHPDLKCFVPR